jgi:hypothetical protein
MVAGALAPLCAVVVAVVADTGEEGEASRKPILLPKTTGSMIATDEQSTSNNTLTASTGNSSSNSHGGNAGNQLARSAHGSSNRNN